MVTDSAAVSVNENDTCPLAPVTAGDGAPMVVVVEDDWRLTVLPATGLLVDESKRDHDGRTQRPDAEPVTLR